MALIYVRSKNTFIFPFLHIRVLLNINPSQKPGSKQHQVVKICGSIRIKAGLKQDNMKIPWSKRIKDPFHI